MREILIATGNPGKAREMREILIPEDSPMTGKVRWRFLEEFSGWPEAVEDGDTFEANACRKAMHYARLSGLWTLADDSGLEVDALNGQPGVLSARFAGEARDDAANNALLLEKLVGVPPERRAARFRCAAVISDGNVILAAAGGAIEGRIIDQPRGSNGFGYDPLFLVPALGQTSAELSSEQKHAISHRGQALARLSEQLFAILRAEAGGGI
ncbi:MAG: RdgB/HAM1 family non-canonical purine NTP pyrophosphatase [Phycisphaerales bacterium]|nr:RdgB/HAM1 family non-canonical purine NTP pyrophosphatase [Phycisphaerales bacterium]